MTFPEAIKLFLDEGKSRQLSPRFLEIQHLFLERFADWSPVDDVREVTQKYLLDFHQSITQKPFSIGYRNSHTRTVRGMFQLLYKRELILTDITLGLPEFHTPKRLPRNILNAKQVMKLLKTCRMSTATGFRDRAIFEVLYSTGLRGGELCRLTLYDLDLSVRTLRVLCGKGKKDRVVPVGKIACAYLAEYLKNVRPLLLKGKESSALFIGVFGRGLNTNMLRQQFNLHRDRAQLGDTINVHSLRHSCATEMLKGGASIRHVQELLGHASINTTQIYTHVVQDDLKAVHAKTAPSERRKNVEKVCFDLGNARWSERSYAFTGRKKKGKKRK